MYTFYFFFFNDTATTEIYTLSLHDALPIFRRDLEHLSEPTRREQHRLRVEDVDLAGCDLVRDDAGARAVDHDQVEDEERSEEHTSELQSRQYLVCRLLLEKKKNKH